uniref:TATA-binding protein-associated phosphoprotein n=1 Tax=Rhizophora mucronata TaxID=61149 RepID=A0A2P2LKE3_RHIMU
MMIRVRIEGQSISTKGNALARKTFVHYVRQILKAQKEEILMLAYISK